MSIECPWADSDGCLQRLRGVVMVVVVVVWVSEVELASQAGAASGVQALAAGFCSGLPVDVAGFCRTRSSESLLFLVVVWGDWGKSLRRTRLKRFRRSMRSLANGFPWVTEVGVEQLQQSKQTIRVA